MFKGRRDTECEGKELELKETKKMIFCHGSFVRVFTLFPTEVERTLSRPLLLAWVFVWPLGGAIVSQWNGGLRSSPEKPPKFILPKNSQHTQRWTLNTSERLHKKRIKALLFYLWCSLAVKAVMLHRTSSFLQTWVCTLCTNSACTFKQSLRWV